MAECLSKQMGVKAYWKKGWLIFRKEGTKAFTERLVLWSDVANLKDAPKAIWVLALSQIVHRVGKIKKERELTPNQKESKEWLTHLHTGTWDNKAKESLWESRLKAKKKFGATRAKHE